jgi:hypothetical protein
MHDHPRRFLDDDEILILVHDLERDVFGFQVSDGRCRVITTHRNFITWL